MKPLDKCIPKRYIYGYTQKNEESKVSNTNRYYSTQRPFGPGTYPRQDGMEIIVNFDCPTFCEEIGREAWGYIEYTRPIGTHLASEYELIRGGTSGRVITGTDENGKSCAFVEKGNLGDRYKVEQRGIGSAACEYTCTGQWDGGIYNRKLLRLVRQGEGGGAVKAVDVKNDFSPSTCTGDAYGTGLPCILYYK